MNIILFEAEETDRSLPLSDRRAQHILDVLRFGPGDSFDAGLVDGPRGKATIAGIEPDVMRLDFAWGEEPPPLDPIALVLGVPRPQSARKVLEEATSLGVAEMHFVITDRGDPNYAQSRLWTTAEWRRHLVDGAAQAFTTRLPRVSVDRRLDEAIDGIPAGSTRLALDNYEGARRLSEAAIKPPIVLAIGPERGWSARERNALRDAGFQLTHLGERVLRVETACVSAIAIIKARLNQM